MIEPPGKREDRLRGRSQRDTGIQASANHRPAAMGDQAERRFAVMCPRDDGTARLFQRYTDRREAEAVAKTLRSVGCQANVLEEASP